jgi:2-oxo-3-hexenedioate decarboxylase
MTRADITAIAERLIGAQDAAAALPLITAAAPDFSIADGYAVLAEIERRRRAQGWQVLGRKIGFTNRTIWPRYNVYQPNWAYLWNTTVEAAHDGKASLALNRFIEPRIEPEVVFKLRTPVAAGDDPAAVLAATEWIAPGFEIVQSHFANWKFAAADTTADCALHGALVLGRPVAVNKANRAWLADALSSFTLTLSRGNIVMERGNGANVLGSPALALAHLAGLLAELPQFPPLSKGEIVTTGTLTDAFPVKPGETWTSDYGELGIGGMTLNFTSR